MNDDELEERLDELRKRYAVENRKGNHDKAYEAVQEARQLKAEHGDEDVEAPAEEESGLDEFEAINGVGPELAEVLADEFGSVEDLAEADPDDLEPVPGIGEKRAVDILGQLRGGE